MDKRKVSLRAEWFDIKYLCSKQCGVPLSGLYVRHIDDYAWVGWVVSFDRDVDFTEIKRNVFGVLLLSKRVIYIGVYRG